MHTRALSARLLALLACFSLLFTSIPAALPPAFAQEAGEPAHVDDAAQANVLTGTVTSGGNGLAGVTITATRIEPTGKKQIILVPGVMGTTLYNHAAEGAGCDPTGTIWLRAANLLPGNANLTPLYLDGNGTGPLNSNCQILPDGLLKVGSGPGLKSPYDEFIRRAEESYDVLNAEGLATGDRDKGYLGYDWRMDLEVQAGELWKFINNPAYVDPSRPLFLVTHSMGGLVVKAFMSNPEWASRVSGVVSVAPPYLGAPLFAERLMSGKTGAAIDYNLGPQQVKELMRYAPGTTQLMPSPSWFVGSGRRYLNINGVWKDNYTLTGAFFVDNGNLDSDMLPKATSFHTEFDGFTKVDPAYFNAGKRYFVLFATNRDTPFEYIVQGCASNSTACRIQPGLKEYGDGTVPWTSASLVRLPATERAGATFCRYGGASGVKEHGDLLDDDKVITDILHAIAGEDFAHCVTSTASAADEGQWANAAGGNSGAHRNLVIWGDVRVRVINALGVFNGPDDDGIVLRELPDVGYELTAGGVFVTLPLLGEYRLEILQTGSEPVTILASDYGDAANPELLEPKAKAAFSEVGALENASLTLSNAGAPLANLTLTIDANADGTPEETLEPDAVLDTPEQAQDFTPPTSAITLSGTKDEQGHYTGPVTVSVTATDTGGAGVLASYVSLNAGATWQQYTTPVTVQPGAATSVQVYTTDKAGNQEYPPIQQPLDFGQATHRIYLSNVGKAVAPRAAEAALDISAIAAAPSSAEVAVMGPLPAPFGGADLAAAAVTAPVAPAVVEALVYTTTTNALGNYAFSGLPLGSYRVTAQLTGYSMLPLEKLAIVTVLPSNTNKDINFTATPFTPGEDVLIPEGSFTMGCDPAIDPSHCVWSVWRETPHHRVSLSAYRIDKYEVTNARYAACVAAGYCTAPHSTQTYNNITREYFEYYGVPAYSNHPVVNVLWYQADAFCQATGGRLPTEAEWERAARGKNDRRVWPWGNTLACSDANVANDQAGNACQVGHLTAVGAYQTDASPEGVMDMTGNAWEWVNDWAYRVYTEDTVTNPLGPESGSHRGLRGGSVHRSGLYSRITYRFINVPEQWSSNIGFRCVRSP